MEIVLVHGAYHGAWCWDFVVPELRKRGHSVLAVDLPISDPDAGTAEYAATAIEDMSAMEEPVVVGHSMGGLVVPLIATQRPVASMVFLAAFLPEPGSSVAEQRAREPLDPDVKFTTFEFTDLGDRVFEVGASTATEMFYHDVPPSIAEWAVRQLRPQSYRFMDEVTPLETWPECRAEYIVCADDHAINPEWGRRAAAVRLNVEPHEIGGGHSAFLTHPAKLAEMIHDMAVESA